MTGHAIPPTDAGDHARLEQLLADALRLARRPGPRRDRLADTASARDRLRDACTIARSRGLGPEHVIVTLKRVWSSFADSATRQEAQEVLDWTVSTCIEQYFVAPGPAAAAPRDLGASPPRAAE